MPSGLLFKPSLGFRFDASTLLLTGEFPLGPVLPFPWKQCCSVWGLCGSLSTPTIHCPTWAWEPFKTRNLFVLNLLYFDLEHRLALPTLPLTGLMHFVDLKQASEAHIVLSVSQHTEGF